MKKIIRFIPSILWMLVIFYFSSKSTTGIGTNTTNRFLILKSFHLIEYAILSFLLYFAFKKPKISIPIAYFYSLSDEFHQTFIAGRSGRFRDTLIDLLGIIIGFFIFFKIKNIKISKKTKSLFLSKKKKFLSFFKKNILLKLFLVIIFIICFLILFLKLFFNKNKSINNEKIDNTINLEIDSSKKNKKESFIVTESNNQIKGQKIFIIKNKSKFLSKLFINLNNISSDTEELTKITSLRFYINNVSKIIVPLNNDGAESLNRYWNDDLTSFGLKPDEKIELKVEWFESGNRIGDVKNSKLSFDLDFRLSP